MNFLLRIEMVCYLQFIQFVFLFVVCSLSDRSGFKIVEQNGERLNVSKMSNGNEKVVRIRRTWQIRLNRVVNHRQTLSATMTMSILVQAYHHKVHGLIPIWSDRNRPQHKWWTTNRCRNRAQVVLAQHRQLLGKKQIFFFFFWIAWNKIRFGNFSEHRNILAAVQFHRMPIHRLKLADHCR